jgi:hypothetical protein
MRYQIAITNITQGTQRITHLTPAPKIDIHSLLIPEGSCALDTIEITIENTHQNNAQTIASIDVPPPPAHHSSRNGGIARVIAKAEHGITLTVEYNRKMKDASWVILRGIIGIPEPPAILQSVLDFVKSSYILNVIQDQIDAFQREMNSALTEKWRLEGLLEDARKIIANRERDIGILSGMLEDERGKLEAGAVGLHLP